MTFIHDEDRDPLDPRASQLRAHADGLPLELTGQICIQESVSEPDVAVSWSIVVVVPPTSLERSDHWR